MSSKRPKSASRVRPVDQGFYSDMLNHGSEQPDVDQAQLVEENLQWQSVYKGVTPALGQVPDLFTYGHDTRAAKLTQFEDTSFLPKTQTPLYVPPGQAPRKLVIERKRREYTEKRIGSRILAS